MPEDSYSFASARSRLEEIVTQVRKKDTSLEKSLDLLEEGVRLANQCTELIDHADWESAGGEEPPGAVAAVEGDNGEQPADVALGDAKSAEPVGEPFAEAADDERS